MWLEFGNDHGEQGEKRYTYRNYSCMTFKQKSQPPIRANFNLKISN
jgi:hypothetical protein